jgi:hypothetical protein
MEIVIPLIAGLFSHNHVAECFARGPVHDVSVWQTGPGRRASGSGHARLLPTSAVDFVSSLRKYSRMSEKSDSKQIDDIIAQQSGWKQDVLVALRAAIMAADPAAVEVVKYKKPSKPEGVPFWTHDGDVCFVDVLKSAVRLTFARGARMERSDLFNTRLDSKVVRAIDYFDGDRVDEAAVKALVAEAVELNVAAR